jgi:hypothetical protein
MRKIYGPGPSCVKGKTTRTTPGTVINRLVVMAPGERLCMDVYFLSYITRKGRSIICPFLQIVDDYTGGWYMRWLKSRTHNSVKEALFSVIEYFNYYNWVIQEIS